MQRERIVGIFLIGAFLFLLLSLLNYSVLQRNKYRRLSDKNSIRLISQEGARGRVFDRNGDIIVDNRLTFNVLIMPQGKKDKERIFKDISSILKKDIRALNSTFKKEYISSSLPVVISRNISLKEAIALEEMRMDFPEILIQPQPLRYYPYGKLACHLLGYVNEIDRWRLTKLSDYGYNTKDMVGYGGVEERYDYYLRQEEGGSSIEVDHQGRFVRLLGFKMPHNGKDLQLTLDLKIQKIAEDKLNNRKGSVIIMDPYTGEIIAMASSPGFDPSLFVNKSGSLSESLFKNADAPFINRAISSTYPAGSLFKIVVATAGLETKKINSKTTFVCNGGVQIGRNKFNCWDAHGRQNIIEAITHSCNVFFYRAGLILGPQAIYDYALKLGFSRNTSFDLPYEASGFIPSPLWRKINKFRNWFDGDTANLAIGQGEVLVTPLQIVRMMAIFANEGYLVNPHIIKAIDGKDVSGYFSKITRISIGKDTLEYIKEGLKRVVLDPGGTGNVLSGVGVVVAGKTGTAQAPPLQSHAWFAGYFPAREPKYVICVLLEHGGPGYISCVIAKQIIQEMISEGVISGKEKESE